MNLVRSLARRCGYDLVPRRKPRDLAAQLDLVLKRAGITLVLDVGANVGQYARKLRAYGYDGRIVSFEPLAAVHEKLAAAARSDPGWEVAPRMALGAQRGEIVIGVSAESDMSSVLEQSEVLRAVSPSSRIVGHERVRMERLDVVAPPHVRAGDRIFLKADTQGYEQAVLDGASGLLERIQGVQLELPLVPCYEGEAGLHTMWTRLEDDGFEVHLVLPGYFERKLARHLQVDLVFMRASAPAPRS